MTSSGVEETKGAWRRTRVAVVGNFNPPNSGMKFQAEVLADAFANSGASVERVTFQQGRYRRPLSTMYELVAAKSNFDVLCIQAFSFGNFANAAAAILVGRALGKRVVVVYRGGGGPRFIRRFRPVVLPILRLAHEMVVPSGYLNHHLAEFRLATTIVPNVINLAQFPFRQREAFPPRLVWVRHLRTGYNPWMAVEVLRRVQIKYPEATLTMVGEGHMRAELVERVSSESIQGVTFTGDVPQREVAEWLSRSTIFINTTTVDNQPRSVLEAMSAGLPVVSTDVGGIPYLLEDGRTALLVPNGRADLMADRVLEVVASPALGQRLVEAGLQKARTCTWEAVEPRWLAILCSKTREATKR